MQRTGYLIIDHSASPGLTEEQARKSGYDPKLCKEGKTFEADTLTCCHCTTVVIKNPLRTRPRASCFKCGHRYLCDFCAIRANGPDYDHAPFEKQIEMVCREVLGSPLDLLKEGH